MYTMCENPEEDGIAHLAVSQHKGVVSTMNTDGMLTDGAGVCGNGTLEVPAVMGGDVRRVALGQPAPYDPMDSDGCHSIVSRD